MTGAGGAVTTQRLSWVTRLSARRLARGRAGAAIAACASAETPTCPAGSWRQTCCQCLVRRVASVSSSPTGTR